MSEQNDVTPASSSQPASSDGGMPPAEKKKRMKASPDPAVSWKKAVEKNIGQLEKTAAYWRDKHAGGLTVIQAYTLTASIVMGVNLILKANVRNIGGWLPFCIAATVLTAVATFFTNRQLSETPKDQRDRCLVLLAQFRAFLRELISKQWTAEKLQKFETRYKNAEKDAASYLLPPSVIRGPILYWVMLPIVVAVYAVFEALFLSGHLEPILVLLGMD